MTLLVGKYLNWAITAAAGSGFLLYACTLRSSEKADAYDGN